MLQDMLPDYIQMRVAESILFVGKAVRVLRNPSPSFQSQKDGPHQQSRTSNRLQGVTGSFSFQKESFLAGRPSHDAKLLPQSEADKIAEMLQELKVPIVIELAIGVDETYRCYIKV
jgi:gamma-tubulin complex component 4